MGKRTEGAVGSLCEMHEVAHEGIYSNQKAKFTHQLHVSQHYVLEIGSLRCRCNVGLPFLPLLQISSPVSLVKIHSNKCF